MTEEAPPLELPGGTATEPVDSVGATFPACIDPALHAPLALGPGARLGRYEVIGRLGTGAMGIVLEARDTELDRTVALKVVRPRSGDLAAAQARLRREAQAMARLSHPNVAAVFDIGTVGDQLFIAMELVRGGTLRDLVGKRRPWRDELRTLIDAGRGLAAAHEAGVIHRDFKPDNVLVRDDGTVRVADFGLAREAADPRYADAAPPAPATRTAGVAGTLAYMAPECFDGVADAATDQFAFAVTAFEVLEGRRPFDRGSSLGAFLCHLRDGRRNPWRRRELPTRVRAAIDRGLAADPAARWPSLSALCDALEARPPRARGWALALVLAAAAAATTAAIALRAPTPARPSAPVFTEAARQQLTFSGDASLPSLSPDGRWLAYAIGYERREVAVQDLRTGRSRVVHHGASARNLKWSHDSTRLLIGLGLGGTIGNIVLDRDGTHRALIPGCALYAWSPDDTRVVVTCDPPEAGLDLYDLATRTRRHVALALDATWVLDLDWSRLDRLVLLTYGRAGYQLWTLQPDGTDLRVVHTDATSSEVRLTGWSADGQAIFHERIRDQISELVRLDIDPRSGTSGHSAVLLTMPAPDKGCSIAGDARSMVYARVEASTSLSRWGVDDAPRALTADTREKSALVLSRDRQRIAFVAGAGDRKQIFIGSRDATNAKPIPNIAAEILDLDLSPAGTHLAYSVLRDGNVELWTAEVATGETRQLAHSPVAEHGDLVWMSPGELLYAKLGNRAYRVLELATGREREVSSRWPSGWIFHAELSPDGRRIAVEVNGAKKNMTGIWSISLDDGSAQRLYFERLAPIGWSEDGAWVYVQDHTASMTYAIAASGTGEIRPLLAPPRRALGKIRILPDERTALAIELAWRSDVWRISLDGTPPPLASGPLLPAPEPQALPAPTNGDMSRGIVGRAPDGWSPVPFSGAAAMTDRCLGASDRCAIVSHGGWLDQRVAADAYRGKRVRVRARAHATAGRGGLGLWLQTPTEESPLGYRIAVEAAGWPSLEIVTNVRPDARHLIIRLSANYASTALFDDVVLEAVAR